jgi:hypothetical protein
MTQQGVLCATLSRSVAHAHWGYSQGSRSPEFQESHQSLCNFMTSFALEVINSLPAYFCVTVYDVKYLDLVSEHMGTGVAQSFRCLTTDWTTRVRSPAEAKTIYSPASCVQISSEAHPASCTMGTGGPFPGVKRRRGLTLTTHHSLIQFEPWSADWLCFCGFPQSRQSNTVIVWIHMHSSV